MSSPRAKTSPRFAPPEPGAGRRTPPCEKAGEGSGCPASATNALLISRPSSVRIGIAWRFGFEVESRPVAATVWLNVVWRRPSSGEIWLGGGPGYVFRGFEDSRRPSLPSTLPRARRLRGGGG